ncbi:bifunctional diaminohydroxyphosphoribosylaminopyrimidine deaminase/5-amino-6-(5-phosphoribosylamino)uracil reductase RibD [Thalassotalea profundi]|uniref:Riboflavin biosynthesis protein RibD n=1 Tax=Thalassotalea profundi TaxID=2036687 RepID=A0ABQ3IWJ2_9GAMM|nr:bifunctional diaminohydroxyphosphoribosylaminopyrimidine deaminase/5-amino-6-(5-phosphoribosylamino)uracil reductase RibD [Thalassotalea profundi]GHE94879.1 riboflavin biosynthesis protein RibD [Thalassotalea profundi]
MNHFTQLDHQFMARALNLAKKGRFTTSPNPRVGCVLVNNGDIVGEGFHVKAGSGHAEVNALAQAGNSAKGATAYVTLEPCSHFGRTPPCSQALINAGVQKVICAMVDPNPKVSGKGLAMLNAAGIETASGLLEIEAKALNIGFIKLMTTNIPYVRCKLATSLDGKTAMANGESQWITSPEARKDVQALRAQSCAIIAGADSILVDNARMTVRWSELGQVQQYYSECGTNNNIRQPIRVIIDTKNRLTPDLALFDVSVPSPIILIRKSIENSLQWPHFVEQVVVPMQLSGFVDLPSVLALLAKRGLNDVLLEAGKTLAGAFIDQNLVDELILYQAPKLMGENTQGSVKMPSVEHLSQAKNLMFTDVTMVGKDIRIKALFK